VNANAEGSKRQAMMSRRIYSRGYGTADLTSWLSAFASLLVVLHDEREGIRA
jgi:hypothetical protein